VRALTSQMADSARLVSAAAELNRVRRLGTERRSPHRVDIPKGRGRVAEEFRIRYRDPSGCELISLPKPTVAGAIRHARVIEQHHGTVLAIVGPDGDLSWDEVSALAEVMLKPPVG
jgi:hypothetical protein